MAGIDLSKLEDVDDGKKELAIKRNGKIMKPAKDVPVVTLEAVPVARSGQTQTGAVSTLGTTAVSAFGGAKLGIGAAVVQGCITIVETFINAEKEISIEKEVTKRYIAGAHAWVQGQKERTKQIKAQEKTKRYVAKEEAKTELIKEKYELERLKMEFIKSEDSLEFSRRKFSLFEHIMKTLLETYHQNMENYERSGYQNENIKELLEKQENSIKQYMMQLSQFRESIGGK